MKNRGARGVIGSMRLKRADPSNTQPCFRENPLAGTWLGIVSIFAWTNMQRQRRGMRPKETKLRECLSCGCGKEKISALPHPCTLIRPRLRLRLIRLLIRVLHLSAPHLFIDTLYDSCLYLCQIHRSFHYYDQQSGLLILLSCIVVADQEKSLQGCQVLEGAIDWFFLSNYCLLHCMLHTVVSTRLDV